jgi:3-isopropylmalate/(R)-2-methylmalate dehydratase small subunit
MPEPVGEIVGRAVPLNRSDVDTDQIIPSDWLKRVERTGFGEGLFSEWRESSDFVLNRAEYQGDDVRVLVAGPNFGTGSSREHAPWALEDYGFEAIISPRFADIFRNNCLKIGLVPVELPQEVVDQIMAAVEDDPTLEIVVDVVDRRVAVPALDLDEPFHLDAFHHHRLVNGLDDIALTLQHADEITAYESTRAAWLPSLARSASITPVA